MMELDNLEHETLLEEVRDAEVRTIKKYPTNVYTKPPPERHAPIL
jgi:hypothetical protein